MKKIKLPKLLSREISLDRRQDIDILLWFGIISIGATTYVSFLEFQQYTIYLIIILVILFRFMYVNNKIALKQIKEKKQKEKEND